MNLRELECFVAVYEAKGFARAALALKTAQSNVSTHIRRLENELGVQLFDRRQRGIVPTPKGERLYQHAKRVIALVADTENALRDEQAA